MRNKLFAEVWGGEFGWEVAVWVPRLRAMSREYDFVEVCCVSGHEALYEDFADVISWPNNDFVINNRNMWLYNEGNSYQFAVGKQGHTQIVEPNRDICMGDYPSEYAQYGTKSGATKYDVLIHARATDNAGTGYRNYHKWPDVVKLLDGLRVACIGTQADYVCGDDLRGIPLAELCDVMAESRCVVGSSSGPMHLAAFCGTPIVVWAEDTGGRVMKNRTRYLTTWNPFGVKVEYIDSWQPEPQDIVRRVGLSIMGG